MNAYKEIVSFSQSYRGKDFVERNKEEWNKFRSQLSEGDKKAILSVYAENGNILLLSAFVSTIDVDLTSEDCKKYMQRCIEASIDDLEFLFFQKMLCDGIKELECKLPSEEVALFISSMIIQSIRFDMLYVVQDLLQKKMLRYDEATQKDIREELSKQPDLNIAELIDGYFENGMFQKDATDYFNQYGAYKAKIIEAERDYFTTKGREICRDILESYERPCLLSDETTIKELNAFVDIYNWDDGVEIPYFIMKHKNCDIALRKRLFRLGAGDCIDKHTYIDTNKDPWKQFILELKEMIEKEEQ
jgi:hypothetical protein